MEERERGAGRLAGDQRDDDRTAPVTPAAPAEAASVPNDDAEFRRQMEIGRRGMRKHRNVLAALAK